LEKSELKVLHYKEMLTASQDEFAYLQGEMQEKTLTLALTLSLRLQGEMQETRNELEKGQLARKDLQEKFDRIQRQVDTFKTKREDERKENDATRSSLQQECSCQKASGL